MVLQPTQKQAANLVSKSILLNKNVEKALEFQRLGYTIFRLSGFGQAPPLCSMVAWTKPSLQIKGDPSARGYWDLYATKEDLIEFKQQVL